METKNAARVPNKLLQWGLIGIAVGFLGNVIWAIPGLRIPAFDWILWPAALTGVVLAFIGGSKAWGMMKTGGYALLFGAILFIAAHVIFYPSAETFRFMGSEFYKGDDFFYLTGAMLNIFGVLIAITGLILLIVGYARRVLKAVEGRPTN